MSSRLEDRICGLKLKKRLFDKLSAELELNEDYLSKLALKLIEDIDKKLPKIILGFNDRFPDVKTGEVLKKEIIKQIAFFKKIFYRR